MNAEMQKEAQAVPNPKPEMRFVYFGRMEKLGINSKNEEYIQWIHDGVTCVGHIVTDTGELLLGASFCSPEDEFSKKKARMIIKGRMSTDKLVTVPAVAEGKSYPEMSYEELIAEIRECLNSTYDSDTDEFAGVPWPLWFQGV